MQPCPFFLYACIMILRDNLCPFCTCTNSQIYTNITMLRDRNNCMSLRTVSLRGIGENEILYSWSRPRATDHPRSRYIKCIYKRDYSSTRSMRLFKFVDLVKNFSETSKVAICCFAQVSYYEFRIALYTYIESSWCSQMTPLDISVEKSISWSIRPEIFLIQYSRCFSQRIASKDNGLWINSI